MGVTVGCRKHNFAKSLYYRWVEQYNANGLDGLLDRRQVNQDALVKRLEKENRILKELMAENELEAKMKDEQLKKSLLNGRKKGNNLPVCEQRIACFGRLPASCYVKKHLLLLA